MYFNSYRSWHHGGLLCEVPVPILENLKNAYEVHSQAVPEQNLKSYKQWHLQYSKTDDRIDSTYIHWKDKSLVAPSIEFFNQYVKFICRFRVSLLNGGGNVEYHRMHRLPRIHIPLNECNAIMVIQESDGTENEIPLEYGKAYFTNVTKLHKVIGDKEKDRINAFFCFTDFSSENLKKQLAYKDI